MNEQIVIKKSEYIAPYTLLEKDLAQMWNSILKVDKIGLHDDFFEIGGTSIQGIEFSNKIRDVWQDFVDITAIFVAPTISQLSLYLCQKNPDTVTRIYGKETLAKYSEKINQKDSVSSYSSVFSIQQQGNKPPFFFINSMGYAQILGSYIGLDQPFYCLNIFGLTQYFKNKSSPLKLAEIAAKFVEDMQTIQPQGPYFLGTYCAHSFLTIEIAQQLQALGQKVALLVLIDLIDAKLKQGDVGFNHHWRNFSQFGINYILEKVKNKVTHSSRKLAISFSQVRGKLYPKNEGAFSNYLDDTELLKSFKKIRNTYPSEIYQGNVTLFLSSERAQLYSPHLSNLVSGEIEVDEIPGYHHTLFEAPYVQVLAEKLRYYIDKSSDLSR